MAERKHKLQESLQWHQLAFDADSELQCIKDYLPAASSTDYGKNLIDAQKLHKKHQVVMVKWLRDTLKITMVTIHWQKSASS